MLVMTAKHNDVFPDMGNAASVILEVNTVVGSESLKDTPNAPVVFCEGVQAAESARNLFPDHEVVSILQATLFDQNPDLMQLSGREILIWPDYGKVGDDFKEKLIERLRECDAEMPITILKPWLATPIMDENAQPNLVTRNVLSTGWNAVDAMADGWTPAHMLLVVGTPDFIDTVPIDERFGDFVLSKKGVRECNEEGVSKPFCSPLRVLAQTRDTDNRNWGYLLEVIDSDGKPHRVSMPSAHLINGKFAPILVYHGLKISPDKDAKQTVANYIHAVNPEARALCVDKPGWNHGVFVMADKMVGPSTDLVVAQSDNPENFSMMRKLGELQDWQTNVAAYCAGNSRLVFAVCAALTGPTLYWLDEENGGFHFQGKTSIGKTLALKVANSVWGGSEYMQRWRATTNGLENMAARFNDSFMSLDEIGEISATHASETAYMLSNGQGKTRGAPFGAIPRPVAKWRMIYLSTGEVSLQDHLNNSGRQMMGGQGVRLVNIAADAGAGMGLFQNLHGHPSASAFHEILGSQCTQHYGTVGPAWIELLADPEIRSGLLESIRGIKQSFVHDFVPHRSPGDLYRVARRFGLVAAVGEVCIAQGLLPFAARSAIEASRDCFLNWMAKRAGTEEFVEFDAINQVRNFLVNHANSRFAPWAATSSTSNAAGFKRDMGNGETQFYVLPDVFNREVCAGLDSTAVAKSLVARGYLIPDSSGKSTKPCRLPGEQKSKRVYVLTSAILGNSANDEAVTQVALCNGRRDK